MEEDFVVYREGVSGWETLNTVPPGIRLLLGIDGSLTRTLEFIGCGPVTVEMLPPPFPDSRLVNLCLPNLGPVVQALTRIPTPISPEDREILQDSQPIGPALSKKKGPLIREGLTILKSSGIALEIPEVRRHKDVLWSRIYDLVVYPVPRLTIQEWILPRLQGILEKVHLP